EQVQRWQAEKYLDNVYQDESLLPYSHLKLLHHVVLTFFYFLWLYELLFLKQEVQYQAFPFPAHIYYKIYIVIAHINLLCCKKKLYFFSLCLNFNNYYNTIILIVNDII